MLNAVEVGLFLFLILAPCALAVLVAHQPDQPFRNELNPASWCLPLPRGFAQPALRVAWPETAVTDQFEIRSFPKGLLHRRSLGITPIIDGPALPSIAQTAPLTSGHAVIHPAQRVAEALPHQVESQVEVQLRAHLEAYITAQMQRQFQLQTRQQHRAEIEAEIRAEIEQEMELRAANARAAAMEAYVRSQNASTLNRELEELAGENSRAA